MSKEFKAGDKVLVEAAYLGVSASYEDGGCRIFAINNKSIRLFDLSIIHPTSPFAHGQEVECSEQEEPERWLVRKYACMVDGNHYCYSPDETDEALICKAHVRALPKKRKVDLVELDEELIEKAKKIIEKWSKVIDSGDYDLPEWLEIIRAIAEQCGEG